MADQTAAFTAGNGAVVRIDIADQVAGNESFKVPTMVSVRAALGYSLTNGQVYLRLRAA